MSISNFNNSVNGNSDIKAGEATLYLVATPIGNLGDISERAVATLKNVDIIAAEDTRHSQKLLTHLGIHARVQTCHDHNEEQSASALLQQLMAGRSVALISDAGTPLISDPGYRLVKLALENHIIVSPVPGACAAVAALSAAGLPTNNFVFEGFLPAKQQARLSKLKALSEEARTMVIYESCHRIEQCLQDMCDVFGTDRSITFTRELTKAYETIRQLSLGACLDWVKQDSNQRKGEIVLVIQGAEQVTVTDVDVRQTLSVLIDELPVKQAAAICAKLTGKNRNECYQLALEIKNK